MAKSETLVVSIPNPFVTPSAWTKETYRLLRDFKQDFDRQQGAGASRSMNDSYVLMASDFLEERFGAAAHWDRLEITTLLDRFAPFAVQPSFISGMLSVLGAFYCYLGNIGRIAPQVHARMRQLSLDAILMGPEAAREWFGVEVAERRAAVIKGRVASA